MKKTVFIIHPHSNLIYNVTLNYLVKRLIDEQFNLVIFTNCTFSKAYYKDDQNVQIKTLPLVYPKAPRRPLLYFKKTFLPLTAARSAFANAKKPAIICIDPEGFHAAYAMFPSALKDFNYISFEIFFLDELREQWSIELHQKAVALIKKGIKSLIIPDHYRLKLFLEEHPGHQIGQHFFIPVSPSKVFLPAANYAAPFKTNLKEGERAVIYSGSLYDWSGIKELIASMQHWDKKFHLFIHAHGISEGLRADLEKFIAAQPVALPIQILDISLDYTDYLAFLKQFDIGLATYIPFTSNSPYDGKNFAEIGYSSSKFNTLMMMGIPTITTTNNSFSDIKKEYDFGYVIKDFSEMAEALTYIDQHFEKNKAEASRVYDELLDPTDKVSTFINFLNSTD
jgi:glycosyltransferase involved in cell wall biosynthesis